MENVNHNRRVIIATVAFFAFLGITYFYIFDPFAGETRYLPVGISDFRDRSSYRIDSETILSSLDGGETDVFTAADSAPQSPLFEEPVLWRQSDFLKVARALNQSIREEPLSSWRLYSMNFSTACQDDSSGFTEADFYYFKTIFRDNGKIRYTTLDYYITSQYGAVSWAGGSNFPHPLFGWENIRLGRIQVTAEDALTIAEQNGGRETRSLVGNKCRIHVGLSSDGGWQIFIYEDDTGASLFRMEIDPESGKIE